VEYAVYPLFSPQSLIAEGSANYGIDMAFPGEERTRYERDSLFPLAGLDTSLALTNGTVREIVTALNYARNEVARRYLEGAIDSAGARALVERFWLVTPEAAAKTVRFIDDYRSYVINYNLGRDLVAGWVERQGASADARWRAFHSLLSSPRLPGDLADPPGVGARAGTGSGPDTMGLTHTTTTTPSRVASAPQRRGSADRAR
jgi:hypothetical protein